MDEQPAPFAQGQAPAFGAAEQRHLGEGLRIQRGVAERRCADQPGPGGLPRRGVEQMVRIATLRPPPDPHVQARGRDATATDPQHMCTLPAQRVLDMDVVRGDQGVGTADPDVAAAIDDEAAVSLEHPRHEVRREALSRPTAVEAQTGWPDHRALVLAYNEIAPARRAGRMRRSPLWRGGQRGGQRRAGEARARRAVAGGLDCPDHRRVHEAAAPLRRPLPSPHGFTQQLGGRDALPPVGVEAAELAVLAEARKGPVEVDDEPPGALCCRGGRGATRPRLADQQAHVGAHRFEDDVVLAHDALVVTGAGAAVTGDEVADGDEEETWVVVPAAACAGTTRVTIRRLTTRRISTGLGAVAVGAACIALLSW